MKGGAAREGLWSLLILFGVVASVIQKLKNVPQQQRQDPNAPQRPKAEGAWRQFPIPSNPLDLQSWGRFFEEAPQQPVPDPAPKAVSAPRPVAGEISYSMEGPYSQGSRLSIEGVDTCDPGLGHTVSSLSGVERTALEDAPRQTPSSGFPLSFTPDTLMQGVIMSEILTRPTRRKWSRR